MGVKIYPRRVIDRANVTDRELDRLAEHVREIRTSLGMLGNVGRLSLKGQAWDSARSYVAEVELPYLNTKLQWIEAMKNGNARFRSEAQRLPGVNCLDKDLLEEEFDYWEDRLDREYDREHPRSSVISRCRRMMRDINSKLVAIDVFVQATGGIYDRAAGMQNILDRADTEIKKVSYNPQTNEIQFTSISAICLKGLEQVDVMEAVKVTGLSEEQIREAMKYGFTVQEVCSAWTAVQNSKKKKWRHDVVELLYVAGKAEKLEPVDWKEVVHNSREDMEEIYEWVKHGREDELIRQWLSPGYKMSSAEISLAKGMMKEFWGKGSGREVLHMPSDMGEDNFAKGKLNEEEFQRFSDLRELEAKISLLAGIEQHGLTAIPLFERFIDYSNVKLLEFCGKDTDLIVKMSDYLSHSSDQHRNVMFATDVIGTIGAYNMLGSFVSGVPIAGQAAGKLGGALSKIPLVSKIPANYLNMFAADYLGGIGFNVIPNLIEDIQDGRSVKEIAKNTALSMVVNAGWSIAGVTVAAGFHVVIEKVKILKDPYSDDIIKGGGKYADEIAENAKVAENISEGPGSNIKFGSDTKSIQKLSNQMTQRGWTESTVRNTVSSPHITRISTNKATGNSATVYYNKSGGYVIIDDVTKAVVQVSDNINPSTWIPDPSIINPYKP
jgi:hypothetical protein